jgi:glycosyltransferase involved in cell wall biosynthesis
MREEEREITSLTAVPSHQSPVTSHDVARTTPVDVERVDTMRVRDGIDVSVLVPARDEAENLPRFMELADAALGGTGALRYEVIVIDDGSIDDTWHVLESLRASYPFLRVVRHRTTRGIADALRTGFHHARGAVLVFYPADLQFLPEDIPRRAPIVAGEATWSPVQAGTLREGVRVARLQWSEPALSASASRISTA